MLLFYVMFMLGIVPVFQRHSIRNDLRRRHVRGRHQAARAPHESRRIAVKRDEDENDRFWDRYGKTRSSINGKISRGTA